MQSQGLCCRRLPPAAQAQHGWGGGRRRTPAVPATPTTATHAAAGSPALDTPDAVDAYLRSHPGLLERIAGHADDVPGSASIAITPLTEGKINYVYSAQGSRATVLVKYAPAYVRSVGTSFQLSQARMDVESAALSAVNAWCPQHTAQALHHDAQAHVLVQEHLPAPHAKLLTFLCDGSSDFPLLSDHLALLLSAYLYRSSAFALPEGDLAARIGQFANADIVAANTAVVLVDPWVAAAPSNRHSPQLVVYRAVAALHLPFAAQPRSDGVLAAEVARLQRLYAESRQSLIHNDLHVGNLLVTPATTYLIDWEFATYGPMAFDIGSLIGNFLLAYFASYGLPAGSEQQRAWLLVLLVDTWSKLRAGLAQEAEAARGAAPLPQDFMEHLLRDSIGYAGCVLVRLVVGMHHYPGLEAIQDDARRVRCEAACLDAARALLRLSVQHAARDGALVADDGSDAALLRTVVEVAEGLGRSLRSGRPVGWQQ